jgi:DGQHR domain-containing protein
VRQSDISETVPALRVRQWLAEWNRGRFDPAENQTRPQEFFYLFSLSAATLRQLSGIYRRSTTGMTPRKDDPGIQRRHDLERSAEIRRYVAEGYPRSSLNDAQRKDPATEVLRKPGWLPTAIVINMLVPGDHRRGRTIGADGVIQVSDDPTQPIAELILPNVVGDQPPPIELIDGQHRLFAFDEDDPDIDDFELPVVAFRGLDISWQAYLFWTINIRPKRINASLAYDLYPLLREEDWLDSGDQILAYRESRAQELTELLWANPDSPWHQRINMLGGPRRDNGPVTQAAFIRSLIASMVKSWKPKGRARTGGIFGGTRDLNDGLAWSRTQQAAFLVTAWKLLENAVRASDSEWAEEIRSATPLDSLYPDADPAFSSSFSLLATDQGVRGYQSVVNDLCYVRHSNLKLDEWRDLTDLGDVSIENVSKVAKTIPTHIRTFLSDIARGLATYDWRSSSFPTLTNRERLSKAALRGSGGYKELREQLFSHLSDVADAEVSSAARDLIF